MTIGIWITSTLIPHLEHPNYFLRKVLKEGDPFIIRYLKHCEGLKTQISINIILRVNWHSIVHFPPVLLVFLVIMSSMGGAINLPLLGCLGRLVFFSIQIIIRAIQIIIRGSNGSTKTVVFPVFPFLLEFSSCLSTHKLRHLLLWVLLGSQSAWISVVVWMALWWPLL